MAIHIYNGLPGSGKSLKLASICLEKLSRNKKYFDKAGVRRMLLTNLKLLPWVEEKYEGFIKYWSDPSILVQERDCDIIWDEVATYLDSTQWASVPLELKRFLQLHRHYGIEIFGSTQDFPMIDISMRRLVKRAFLVRKILGSRDKSATRPPVDHPWGVVLIREIDSATFTKEREEYKFELVPSILFITKGLCNTFDTTQELVPGEYPAFRHVLRHCGFPGCKFTRITHI